MKKTNWGICFVSFFLLLQTMACNDKEEIQGVGTFSLGLKVDGSYPTKSVDVDRYQSPDNYAVEVSQHGAVIKSFLFRDMPLLNDLTAGEYSVKAYLGTNVNAAFDSLYVEGNEKFNLNDGDTKEVQLTCVPANVKVNVTYSDDLFAYYSDCTVDLKTSHLEVPFAIVKADADRDAFFKANTEGEDMTITIKMKDLAGNSIPEIKQTKKVKPRDFLTITVKPKLVDVAGGAITGITVTINSETFDKDIDITIPDEMLPNIVK